MNRLKQLRKEKELTLDDLSKATRISRATLNRYENGDSEPKQATWQQLADYFGVSAYFAMGLETTSSKNKLKELRESFGLSLGDLSEELQKKGFKVGRASLNNYENGIQQPKQETWERLADYFDVSVAYIMGLNTALNKNEISISKLEYERLKVIEQKYNEIKSLVAD